MPKWANIDSASACYGLLRFKSGFEILFRPRGRGQFDGIVAAKKPVPTNTVLVGAAKKSVATNTVLIGAAKKSVPTITVLVGPAKKPVSTITELVDAAKKPVPINTVLMGAAKKPFQEMFLGREVQF